MDDKKELVKVEVNLANIPFISASSVARGIPTKVEVPYSSGKGRITVASGEGVPTTIGFDIVMYLLRKLTSEEDTFYIDEHVKGVKFTYNELLVNVYGEDAKGGDKLRRIKAELRRLGHTVIGFELSLITPHGTVSSEDMLPLFQRLTLYSPRKGESYGVAVFSSFIQQNIQANLYRYVDYQIYKRLPRGFARRLAVFLLMRLGDQDKITYRLSTLARSLYWNSFFTQRKRAIRQLKKALDAMQKLGLIGWMLEGDVLVVVPGQTVVNRKRIFSYAIKYLQLNSHLIPDENIKFSTLLGEYSLRDIVYAFAIAATSSGIFIPPFSIEEGAILLRQNTGNLWQEVLIRT